MSIKECTSTYVKQLVEEKQMFRDLFGKQELDIAIRDYFAYGKRGTLLEFLKEEKERKLREQDAD